MKKIFFLILLFPFFSSAQIVEEIVQIDTTTESLKVIYHPENTSSYYFKKIAVFANDTSQIAVEKSFTNYGQNGVYKVFYPNGRLKIKTVYANNKINGEWVYYNPKGVIITKGLYKNGVKHGYWAYKSIRTYGRYKNGYKNKRWKRFDESENKYISHYRKGVLQSGEGFGTEMPFYISTAKKNAIVKDTTINSGPDSTTVNGEYEQAISFLKGNVMFRKALKKHFGTSMKRSVAVKKQFDNSDRFQFVISPEVKALALDNFIAECNAGNIVVPKINTILKEKSEVLKTTFNGVKIKENANLHNNSTDKESSMEVVFSELKLNFLRLDVNWTFKEEISKFKILLYFDNNGILKGAEYEKR